MLGDADTPLFSLIAVGGCGMQVPRNRPVERRERPRRRGQRPREKVGVVGQADAQQPAGKWRQREPADAVAGAVPGGGDGRGLRAVDAKQPLLFPPAVVPVWAQPEHAGGRRHPRRPRPRQA